jgi:7-cyano-7-deazaguanine synthase
MDDVTPRNDGRESRDRSAPAAIILLSGGLDSTTLLAQVTRAGYYVVALTFRYGQRHQLEVAAAARIAAAYGATHRIVDIDLRAVGGSALTTDIEVPKDRPVAEMQSRIPVTYVPARNTIFLSYALAWAEVEGAHDIFIGVNAVDWSGYPDCRPEFIAAFERVANLATRAGAEGATPIRIRAPLIGMTKRDIIVLGRALGVDYGATTSCYDPDPSGAACGRCDACQLRQKGFREAELTDPAPYQHASLTPP